ncbi:MAG: PaaI family thioesterase, partial [Gammaproteobacteria bacterium]
MLPALHGGVTAAFMETAALLHLLLQIDQDRVPKSIDFAIDYLLPGRPEDCYAECEVSRAGLRVAQTQIRCWQTDPGHPIALARAHFLLAAPE